MLVQHCFHVCLRVHQGRGGSRDGRRGAHIPAAYVDVVRDDAVVKLCLLWQAPAVLGVPARVMSRVHSPPPALGLDGLFVLPGAYRQYLVVGKEKSVAPFLHQGGHILAHLHLPAVVCPGFLGLLEFTHFGVGGAQHVNTPVDDLIQQIQQLTELFGHIDVAAPIPKILEARLLSFRAYAVNAEPLGPVQRINDQSMTDIGRVTYILDLVQNHLPAGRGRHSGHVKVFCTPLCVNKQRVGELAGEG